MSQGFTAIRADHVGGHVAMAAVPYFPHWAIPLQARKRFQPWACTFHTGDSGPSEFVAFGGQAGMIDAVYALLGPLLVKMHGGLFETLAERVEFDLDSTPLQGERLALVADALEAFIASPSFAVDCYLVGADPTKRGSTWRRCEPPSRTIEASCFDGISNHMRPALQAGRPTLPSHAERHHGFPHPRGKPVRPSIYPAGFRH